MMSLVKVYVSKVEGLVNTPYVTKVLYLFLDLAISEDKKASESVSGNLCGVLLRNIHHLRHKQLTEPFINIDQYQIVTRLG